MDDLYSNAAQEMQHHDDTIAALQRRVTVLEQLLREAAHLLEYVPAESREAIWSAHYAAWRKQLEQESH